VENVVCPRFSLSPFFPLVFSDGEERGKLHDALGDPPVTVIVIVAEEVVLSSEESAPRAATDTVIPRSVFNRDEGCAETGHGEIPDFE
jgi:hypothetical protein